MSDSELPILYSFRRCPYAMRARLAIAAAEVPVELREVVLRDKPEAMLAASPKGTVPVLVLEDGTVLEESMDIIEMVLRRNDPQGWLDYPADTIHKMRTLVELCDDQFKKSLDRYKYPNRFEDCDPLLEREKGAGFIRILEARLSGDPYLFGDRFSYADAVILPFVRQFAHVDREWFWSQEWSFTIGWLEEFLQSTRFKSIMSKYPQWTGNEPGVRFPEPSL